MRIRITTTLDRDAVLNSLRDLVEAKQRVVGVVDHGQVSVACRDWLDPLFPRVRVAAFLGRVLNARPGAVIDGNLETHWIGRLASALWLLVIIVGAVGAAQAADYLVLSGIVLTGTVVLIGWGMYVQSAKKVIVAEICRASRGSVV